MFEREITEEILINIHICISKCTTLASFVAKFSCQEKILAGKSKAFELFGRDIYVAFGLKSVYSQTR